MPNPTAPKKGSRFAMPATAGACATEAPDYGERLMEIRGEANLVKARIAELEEETAHLRGHLLVMAREEGALQPPRLTPGLLGMLPVDDLYRQRQRTHTWLEQQRALIEDRQDHLNAFNDGLRGIVHNAQYAMEEDNEAYNRGYDEFVARWGSGMHKRHCIVIEVSDRNLRVNFVYAVAEAQRHHIYDDQEVTIATIAPNRVAGNAGISLFYTTVTIQSRHRLIY